MMHVRLTERELNGMLDGLHEGKTVREIALIYGYDITATRAIRNQLEYRFGKDRMKIIYEKSRPSRLKSLGGFAKKAGKAILSGEVGHVSEEEQKRRLSLCNQCEKQQDDKCTFCGCPCKKLVRFRAGDCELGKW